MKRVSGKQLLANRENGAKGGVKTPEGKEVAKLNALKHGLLSKEVLLSSENAGDLFVLGEKLREELAPTGVMEMVLADRMVANVWRLRRAMQIERDLMEAQQFGVPAGVEQTLGINFSYNHTYTKLMRYEASLERGLYRAYHELQRLQAVRRGEQVPAPIAVDVEFSGDRNGFVS